MFTSPATNYLSDWKTLYIGDSSLVRKVQGTNSSDSTRRIIFKQQNGDEIGRIETDTGSKVGDEHTLNAGEEIIGIYGFDNGTWIHGIGIIVWTPPKF